MSYLPQFPLSIVVFPGEELNLHIFEDRYKELIQDCHKNNQLFGIPSAQSDRRLRTGTSVRIKEISKVYPDGKMDIMTLGEEVYNIVNFDNKMEGKTYPGAEVMFISQDDDSDFGMNEQIIERVEKLYDLMNIRPSGNLNPKTFRVCHLVHKIGLTYQQEFNLRDFIFESERQMYVINHLDKLIPEVERVESMRHKIKLNGHFKDLRSFDIG